MGPDLSLCVLMCLYGFLYWSLSILINPSSPCASLCFLKGPNGVLISLYSSLWIPLGFYGSLCVLMRHYVLLMVLIGPYMFLCVLMDSNGSLWVIIGPYVSFLVLMGSYMS